MYNILIVEDDEAIANLLYMDLSDEGYVCHIAGDTNDRIGKFIKHEKFDFSTKHDTKLLLDE